MSSRTQNAANEFARAMRDPHNLIWLHQQSPQSGQGRRHRETTLNRAAVVLTAAAWQAYVQDTAEAMLADLAVVHGSPGYAQYRVVKANVTGTLRRFSTPNARNSVNLLLDLGFDPQPSWSFTLGRPPRPYDAGSVRAEIDDWLDVRHAVAHGSQLPASEILRVRPGMVQASVDRMLSDASSSSSES